MSPVAPIWIGRAFHGQAQIDVPEHTGPESTFHPLLLDESGEQFPLILFRVAPMLLQEVAVHG
eukprot:12421564-Karenia_brevis.AAC.1